MNGLKLNENEIQAAKDMFATAGFTTTDGVKFEFTQANTTFSVDFKIEWERTIMSKDYVNSYGSFVHQSEDFSGWPEWHETRDKLWQLRNWFVNSGCTAKFSKYDEL